MKIKLQPQMRDGPVMVLKQGDVITIDDEVFDFTNLPDGATIAREHVSSDLFPDGVERVNGELEFTLIVPTGPAPAYMLIDPADGELAIPFDAISAPIDMGLYNE